MVGIVGLILALATAVALSACGDDDDDATAGTDTGDKRIAILQAYPTGFFAAVTCGIKAEADKLGYQLEEPQSPKQYDPVEQRQVADAVLARQPDALILMPVDPQSLVPVMKPAVEAGMELITVDQNLADASLSKSFIASNNVLGGREAGRELARQLGGKGKVMVSGQLPGNQIDLDRRKGFEQAVAEEPGLEYLGTEYHNQSIEKAAQQVAAKLRAHPDLAGIFGTDDTGAGGAVTALKEAGKVGDVKVIDFDAQDVGVGLLEEGSVSALIAQRPEEMGRIAMQQLDTAFNDQPTDKTVQTPFTVITEDEVDDPKIRELFYTEETSC
jgi:ribose transport system substrate-binding protein